MHPRDVMDVLLKIILVLHQYSNQSKNLTFPTQRTRNSTFPYSSCKENINRIVKSYTKIFTNEISEIFQYLLSSIRVITELSTDISTKTKFKIY